MTPLEWVKFISIILSIIISLVTIFVIVRNFIKNLKAIGTSLTKKMELIEINTVKQFEIIQESVEDLKLTRIRDEKDRLKESILDFADRLRLRNNLNEIHFDAYEIDSGHFDLMFQNHKKYKEMGGNGYVDEEMKFIIKEFKRLKKKPRKKKGE